jgi:hypothetical protein
VHLKDCIQVQNLKPRIRGRTSLFSRIMPGPDPDLTLPPMNLQWRDDMKVDDYRRRQTKRQG